MYGIYVGIIHLYMTLNLFLFPLISSPLPEASNNRKNFCILPSYHPWVPLSPFNMHNSKKWSDSLGVED